MARWSSVSSRHCGFHSALVGGALWRKLTKGDDVVNSLLPEPLRDRTFRIYLWLAFGITWGVGGIGLLVDAFRSGGTPPQHRPLYMLASYGPSIAGIIMSARAGAGAAVRALLARVVPRRSSVAWYLGVIVVFGAANIALTRLIAPSAFLRLASWGTLLGLLPLTMFIDTGPIGEELGWRGFALPRLLEARTPLNAAIVLGLIWFAWHLPTFFISTLSQSQLPIPLFCVNSIALSILMTWVYLRTAGDLFAMILIHTMANWCGAIGIPFPVEVLAEVGLAALVAVAGGLRRSGETLMPVEA